MKLRRLVPKRRRDKMILVMVMTVFLIGSLSAWVYVLKYVPQNSTGSQDILGLPNYEKNVLYNELTGTCQDSQCVAENLLETTKQYGPQAALDLIQLLEDADRLDLLGDEHQRAHEIGRQTAETFGISGKAFIQCSTAFNYGCMHGFFEYALGRQTSAKEAATSICGSIEKDPQYSDKYKFTCYHGMGHGILMATAYDTKAALDLCDSLETPNVAGCWQGVFMENINGALRGEARSGQFSDTDPLSPCNKLDTKYQFECYLNHAGWLMKVFHNNVALASEACLGALPNKACLNGIGLMITNVNWQGPLSGKQYREDTFESTAWELCSQFPAAYVEDCVLSAVDNILNTNIFDVAPVNRFCPLVNESMRLACFTRVGASARQQINDQQERERQCRLLNEKAAHAGCLQLAGG